MNSSKNRTKLQNKPKEKGYEREVEVELCAMVYKSGGLYSPHTMLNPYRSFAFTAAETL